MNAVTPPMSLSAEDLLHEAACLACRAPSIANSQPWRWRIRRDTLELRADTSRQLTAADPQGRLMILSCGAALHHATVVLAVLGAACRVQRLDDPADPDLLARLTLAGEHPVTAEDMRLHHALRTRYTDRRPFLGVRPLPADVIELLCQTAERFEVSAHVFDPSEVGFLAVAARSAATIQHRDAGYQQEIAVWTTGRDPATRDGVPATAAVEQVRRTVPVRDFAPGAVPGLAAGPGDDRYTTYLAFATTDDTRADWLRTGEAVSAVLLVATTTGLASSMMSDVVEVPGARALLRGVVAPAGHPQLTVRFGVNESAPPLPRSPRRTCGEVIEVIASE
jgi:nitroreductase